MGVIFEPQDSEYFGGRDGGGPNHHLIISRSHSLEVQPTLSNELS